jgi:hypothetical protein
MKLTSLSGLHGKYKGAVPLSHSETREIESSIGCYLQLLLMTHIYNKLSIPPHTSTDS